MHTLLLNAIELTKPCPQCQANQQQTFKPAGAAIVRVDQIAAVETVEAWPNFANNSGYYSPPAFPTRCARIVLVNGHAIAVDVTVEQLRELMGQQANTADDNTLASYNTATPEV